MILIGISDQFSKSGAFLLRPTKNAPLLLIRPNTVDDVEYYIHGRDAHVTIGLFDLLLENAQFE